MNTKRVSVLAIIVSALAILSSCTTTYITQADVDEAYQLGYNDGYAAATALNAQNNVIVIEAEDEVGIDDSSKLEESNTSPQSSNTNSGNSDANQSQLNTQNNDQNEELNVPASDIVSLIATMQASAPVIDTKTITVYDDEGWASDIIYGPGDHIGEYNGIQVDDMFNLYSDAHNEKYYAVTDDLKIVEKTLQNAYEKNWLELGYTNCIPVIRYDSSRNTYEENPYDMVHPGWQHTYAVMYSCTWSDGTPRYGVYYVSVSNDTDQEIMAILCPITKITDGLNFIC